MATVTGFTAERMLQIENETVVSGLVDVNGDLLLYTREGTEINAGYVKGDPGDDATVPDASETVKGKAEIATSAEVIAGTDTGRFVTPAGLAALTSTESRRGLIEIATLAEIRALTDANRAITPEKLGNLEPWIRHVPSGVASSGATATRNTTTGLITLPTGCSMVRIDGVLDPDYETEMILDLEVNSGHATDNSCWMRVCEGTTPNTDAGYQTAGTWGQYNATWGVYSVNGGTIGAIGAVSGAGVYVGFRTTVRLSPWALQGTSSKGYFYDFASFTGGSARGVRAGGYTPSATSQFTGVQFYFNGSLNGLARGTIRTFRRRLG